MNRSTLALLGCTLGLTLLAGSAAAFQSAAPAAIRVVPEAIEIAVGESAELDATVLDADGNELEVEGILFLSMSRREVEVDDDGRVTAHGPGSHTILVMLPDESGSRADAISTRVTVTVPAPPIASVSINGVPETLYAGTRVRAAVEVTDASGAHRDGESLMLSSSDESIASVDRFGNVTAHAVGSATLRAATGGSEAALPIAVIANPASAIELSADATQVRTGDVVHLTPVVRSSSGEPIADMPVELSFRTHSNQAGVGEPPSGRVTPDGRFVADLPGEYTVIASVGDLWTSTTIVATPRGVWRGLELVGHGPVRDRFTSDLWVWEGTDGRDYALTGTWSADGHAYLWDVTDPGNMQLIDTVKVDARTVNDVKVSADGRVAVISREGASNRRNGLVILDVSEPAQGMKVLARYDDELTGGVHNTFIYQDHIYALSAGRRYDIINIEDPSNPHRVGRFELETPGHSIHDVWVEDGIAWSANWDDGIVAVDVGGGGKGGSPRNPILMSSSTHPSGWNHAVFPYRSQSSGKRYVFGGDEAGLSGVTPGYDDRLDLMDGYVHVIEWNDDGNHREVARYLLPEAGSHNLWVEDDILYIAYYQGGLRAIDVSGELLGDLYRQGREIGYFKALDPQGWIPNVAMTWGPQPYKGNIFFSDMHSGLWAVRIAAPERAGE